MADLHINVKMTLIHNSKLCKKTNIGSSQYEMWAFYKQEDFISLVDDNPFLKCLNHFYPEMHALEKPLISVWFPPRMPVYVENWFFNPLWSHMFELFLLCMYSIFFSNLQLQESNWVFVIVQLQLSACKTGTGDRIMPCGQPHSSEQGLTATSCNLFVFKINKRVTGWKETRIWIPLHLQLISFNPFWHGMWIRVRRKKLIYFPKYNKFELNHTKTVDVGKKILV